MELLHGRGNEENDMKSMLVRVLSVCSVLLLMVGCPRFAEVEVHNNTSVTLIVRSSGLDERVEPGKSGQFRFTGDAFQIESSLGKWSYSRNIPHNGENGPFFNGTLRLQINKDGTVYALQKDQRPPQASLPEQPNGYPLRPNNL